MQWYRLKSNEHHLFLKISGKDYLEEQPESVQEAYDYAQETLEKTKEIGEILAQDNRILIVTLDVRECDLSDLNFVTFFKYVSIAGDQHHDIERFDVRGVGPLWRYLVKFLPPYLKERLFTTD